MEALTFETLNSIFSQARLSPYLKKKNDPEQTLAKYHGNIMLSEAMLPSLHYLEICLRNRIDQVLKKYYTQNWLMNTSSLIIPEQDTKKIDAISKKVFHKNKRKVLHDDIVAQMTFGFWCSFFHKKYDPLIWHRKDLFKIIFPNLPRINRKRSYIESKILSVKEIRNRIAHHEPVWDHKISILKVHKMCHELIEAMSYDAIKMLKIIDRFPQVKVALQKELIT